MSTFKQSVSYWCISKTSNDDWKKILDLGITGVELAPNDKFDALRDMGFAIASMGGHQSIPEGLNKRSNHQRIHDEIAENCEIATKYEIPNLIIFSGNRNGLSDEEGAEITVEGWKLIAPLAEKAGVNLVMELLNSKVNHADYQCDTTPWGVEVCKAVGSPRAKLLYDIYHMQIMEGDLIRNIRDYSDYIGHYHTAGNPGRNDLDAQQEIYYPAVAQAIHDTGYRDWLGHEFMPKGTDVVAALKQAYDACLIAD